FTVPAGMEMVSLAQNESLRPPSPLALEAARDIGLSSADYPDPDYPELRQAIANQHQIDAASILCGAGSMELITCIAQAYAGPGAPVLTSQYGYALFRNAAEKFAAPYMLAREPDHTVSIDLLLQSVSENTRLCFVANPGNPTGTLKSNADIRRLRAELPSSVLLVVDEAYGEFCDTGEPPLFDLVGQGNTIVLRTFSKAYGLAAARVGWGVFPPAVAEQVKKLIIPSSISTASAAMATAAIKDQDYMRETCRQTAVLRREMTDRIRTCGLNCRESHTNFVLVEFADETIAQSADQALRQQGLVARGMGGYGLSHCLRLTIAPQETMRLAASTLENWAKEHLA
ncbi:MAG: histidinol-phosphate transaminase, partial [Rhizobiaceae bacterium]